MKLSEYESRETHVFICAKIKLLREILGLSVEELAQESGIKPEDVIAVENGDNYFSENFHSNTKIYEALVSKYGVSMDRLICGRGNVFFERGPNVSYQFYRENVGLFSGVSSKHYPELDDEEEKPPKSPLPGKTAKSGKTKKREGVPA